MEKEKSQKNSTVPSFGKALDADLMRAMTEANKEGDAPEMKEICDITQGEYGDDEKQQPEK